MKTEQSQNIEAIQEWEKQYTHALIDNLKPTGDVLQIGFDLGHAANHIQSFHPKTHTIIESDPLLLIEAKKWAAKHPHVSIVEGKWEKALHHLGSFDAIFFNEVSSKAHGEFLKKLSPKTATQCSTTSKSLLEKVQRRFQEIKRKFSDGEIDEFYKQIGQFNLHELPTFLKNLKENGNISEKQFENALKKFHVEKASLGGQKEEGDIDPLIHFLEIAMKKHLHKGGRVTAFSAHLNSNYEDPIFFDRIATNSNFSYHEKVVKIKIPGVDGEEALVILIHKS